MVLAVRFRLLDLAEVGKDRTDVSPEHGVYLSRGHLVSCLDLLRVAC